MTLEHAPEQTYQYPSTTPNVMSPPVSPRTPPSYPSNVNTTSQPFGTSDEMPTNMPAEHHIQNPSYATAQITQSNPFNVFGASSSNYAVHAPTSVPETPAPANVANVVPAPADDAMQSDVDFWADMGFGASESTPMKEDTWNQVSDSDDSSLYSNTTSEEGCSNVEIDERGLPKGGEYYNARVTTEKLGAIFSTGKELCNTIYSAAGDAFVNIIGNRAVVSFTIDNSAADTAGIALGHVLLKVNGQEVNNTDDAIRLVRGSPRPLNMEFYSPARNVEMVKTEGAYNVKYDTNDTNAPTSHSEWKPKYVVVGDMLGKPHVLYMYRSKTEYDTAVREAQTPGKKLSVKVKQFDIRGAKIIHGKGYVKYPLRGTWHFFTIIRTSGMPIRISATNAEDLQPIYRGVQTFLDNEATKRKAVLEGRMRSNVSSFKGAGTYRGFQENRRGECSTRTRVQACGVPCDTEYSQQPFI